MAVEKVIIAVIDGEVSIIEKPNNVLVEVRDYVVVDDEENYPGYHKDKDGDFYRVFSFPAEEIKLDPIEEDEPMRFINHYRCPDCGHEWNDEWSCQCNDECGECGCSDISPYESEDILNSIGWQPHEDDFPLAGLRTFEVYEDLEMGKDCHPEVKNWIEIFEGMIEKPVIIPSDKE